MRLIFIIKVIAYEDKYLEDVRDLLVELEEYLISIDKDGLDRMHANYGEKMALVDLEEVLNNHGKCFLAIINKKVVGLIMGIIPEYGKYRWLMTTYMEEAYLVKFLRFILVVLLLNCAKQII